MTKQALLSAAATIAFTFTAWTAHADTVQFGYQGVVISCPDTGMPPCGSQLFSGDIFSGIINVDGDVVQPNGSIGSGDIADFQFLAGNAIVIDNSNSVAVLGTVNLDGAGQVQGGALVFETDAIAGAPGALMQLNFGSSLWTIQTMVAGQTVTIASGFGKLTPVPVPGALLMFGPALLAFFGLRRKRAA